MPIASGLSIFAIRRSLIPFAFAMLATLCCAVSASAQTPPQLLPYTSKLIAGGGTTAIATGATCPVSGFLSTDAYGDGCLASEVKLSAPRFVTTDKNGVTFFSDSGNAIIRRIDPTTGIITLVAGGAASSTTTGGACGSYTSTDTYGNGCLANAVKLSKPEGLAFSPAGDLYFADYGNDNIRKIAATNGIITTTGVVTNVVGGLTYGYNVNNTAAGGSVIASTQGHLNYPYGIAFDAAGNLYLADEGNNALEVVNLGSTTAMIQGMSVPVGTIAKFAGWGSLGAKTLTADCPSFISTGTGLRGGCYYSTWTDGHTANTSSIDAAYDLAVDSVGNVYFANEYNENVGLITPANILTTYAGIQGTKATSLVRATAGSFGIGSNFNIAVDALGNVYTSDAVSGVVWRVDAGTKSMYVIAGGAGSVCTGATDTYGDGCPATQAKLSIGTINGSGFATAPGVAGLFVDPFGSLYITDATTNLIRVASSGTQFGNVGASQTNTVDIHFAANDSAAVGGYSIASGATIFSLGTPTCTTNSDNTTDCLLPITASPTAAGAFSGTLRVQSQLNGASTFPLSGNFAQSPVTRIVASASTASSCTSSVSYPPTAVTTLTASLIANGPSAPTGKIIFYANGTALAPITGVAVSNIGTASVPVYGAVLPYTFSTPGTYSITASYGGDSYFKTSTTSTGASITTALPTFTAALNSSKQSTVTAGQTALYSFDIAQTVYSGTITFACSGLPANSACVFGSTSIAASGCSTTSTVAMSIVTQQGATALHSSIGMGGHGPWAVLSTLSGLGLALLVGLRRRRSPLRFNQLWMALALLLVSYGAVGCDSSVTATPSTPSGSYNVAVTVTGSTGTTSSFIAPLTVQ